MCLKENDIFLGWEKGAGKKWSKKKKSGGELSVEDMKKQAAVQCLRSASDEVRLLQQPASSAGGPGGGATLCVCVCVWTWFLHLGVSETTFL